MCAPVSFGVVSAVAARSARPRKVRWEPDDPRRPRRTPRPPATPPPPGTLPAPLPRNPGQIITTSDTVTVRIGRAGLLTLLRKAYLSADTTVPRGGTRTLPLRVLLKRCAWILLRGNPRWARYFSRVRRRVVVRHGRASCRAVVLAAMSARIAQFARGGVAWVCTARKYRNRGGRRRTRMHGPGR